MAGLSATTSPAKCRYLGAKKFFREEIVLVPLTTAMVLKKIEDYALGGAVYFDEYACPSGTTFKAALSPSGGVMIPKNGALQASAA